MLIDKKLIAPCGMNCGVCMGHLRENNKCPGCNYIDKNKPKTRVNCRLRLCTKRKGRFCYACKEFPCDRLEHLDKRYRTKYSMSMIDNLNDIKKEGIKRFIKKQYKKYKCPTCEGLIAVHDKKCYCN